MKFASSFANQLATSFANQLANFNYSSNLIYKIYFYIMYNQFININQNLMNIT